MSRELRVVLSLAAWWLLVALPGLVTMVDVFGPIGTPEAVDGPLLTVWIVGYLVQFAWLMLVVPRAVGHLEAWWLFVASMLPWLVYWASAYGPVEGLLLIAVTGAVTTAMILLALRSLRLDLHGRLVTATVVREIPTRFTTVVNNIYVRRKAELEIPAAGGSSYRGVLTTLYEIGTHPEVGDKLRLRVDPEKPQRFALASSQFSGADT
jgi:hypothetical protein